MPDLTRIPVFKTFIYKDSQTDGHLSEDLLYQGVTALKGSRLY